MDGPLVGDLSPSLKLRRSPRPVNGAILSS